MRATITRSLLALLAALACATCASPAESPEPGAPPAGWFLSGADAASFRAAVDGEAAQGAASGRLESIRSEVAGAATLMQSIPAELYRGRRVRFSAAVRTDGVARWAGLWMRVDRPGGAGAFDNMQARPLRGTTRWARREVVLEVADDATAIHFGLVQDGPGVSRIDAAALDVVGREVPVTDLDRRPRSPINAGFEQGALDGWMRTGFGVEDMVIDLDRQVHRSGGASARLRNRVPTPRGRAMLLQSLRAADHRGKRLRASVWLRGQAVDDAAFWVNVLAAESAPDSEGISRGVCGVDGTFDWTRCEVVLDVPPRARTIHINVYLEGRGTLWIDDVEMQEVGPDVPLTWIDGRPRAPRNGDLEAEGDHPTGWVMLGGARGHYQAVVDREVAHGGRSSARLEPAVDSPQGYGTLVQLFRAVDYTGRRMRLTAWVRGRGIEGRGDLWQRVQGEELPTDGPGMGGANFRLAGSFDWRKLEVVFDVPPGSDSIQWGIGLGGRGTLWIDDVRLDEVGADVPLQGGDQPSFALENGGFENADRPAGWVLAGGGSGDFEATIDRDRPAAGAASARLRSRTSSPAGYGTLMQTLRAAEHRGTRMRARAQLRAHGATAGHFWLRVQAIYSPSDGQGLGGGSCPVQADSDWVSCEIVFDVPEAARAIQLGVGLGGPGAIWLDQVSLETVPATVPLTAADRAGPPGPTNLDFEARPPSG